MYDKKKILVKTVFDETKKLLSRGSKSSVAAYLSLEFEKRFGFSKDERTFVRFYTSLVEKEKDYDIDAVTLDWFSESLGYKDYKTFCSTHNFSKINEDSSSTNINVTFDDEARTLTEKLSQIVVNITTTPIFKLPEFFTKQSGIGIIGVLMIGGILVGKKFVTDNEKIPEISSPKTVAGIIDYPMKNDPVVYEAEIGKEGVPADQMVRVVENSLQEPVEKLEHYMYWNGEKFVATNEKYPSTQSDVIALDEAQLKKFRKVVRLDTITIDNYQNFWYSKYNNKVDFFTAHGENPDNGKGLKQVSKGIFEKYVAHRNHLYQ